LKKLKPLEYSDSLYPLIALSIVINIGLLISLFALFREICSSGIYVWHRNNLGETFQQIIFHLCLLLTLF